MRESISCDHENDQPVLETHDKRTETNACDLISRQEAIDALDGVKVDEENCTEYDVGYNDGIDFAVSSLSVLPSEQQEWNNHTVACLLADLFDDTCACNYNGIDEWLPEKCEVIDACPKPAGVACWEQFLTHRAERRTDG